MTVANGPLAGLLVADLSRVLAGPYAAMLMADLGAMVVKVERPGGGDDTRAWGPPYAASGQSTYFASVNRNKQSIALDFGTPEDRALALRLIARADIVIENSKPGDLQRHGIDRDSLMAAHPSLIWCTISGFGDQGGRSLPGYDLLVQAMGGLMSITGTEEPTKAGVAVVDVLTGVHATTGILAALHHRDATGRGQHVAVSLFEVLLASLVNQASAYVGAGVSGSLLGNAHPSIAPYEVFSTADRPLVIAVGNDRQFAHLAQVLGIPALADDPDFRTNPDRVANRAALGAVLGERLRTHGAEHWQRLLTEVGVPCGPINSIADAFALADRLGLSSVVPIDDARRATPDHQVADPLHLSATPVSYRTAPPHLDEDRDAVLRLLDS